MPSLMSMGGERSNAFVGEVSQMFADLGSRIQPVRAALVDLGLIAEVPRLTTPSPSFVTVDGASIMKQMASIDIIVTCAVSAEGMVGSKQYSQDEAPKMLWEKAIRDHSADYAGVHTKIMSLQEMLLLEDESVKGHDYRIIDGSWTSALIPVTMSMTMNRKESRLINQMLMDGLERGYFTQQNIVDAFLRRDAVWDYADEGSSRMIAVPKSDSARTYSTYLSNLGIDAELVQGVSDRTLASMVLNSGEMLVPAPMGRWGGGRGSSATDLTPSDRSPRSIAAVAELDSTSGEGHAHYSELRDVYDSLINEGVWQRSGDAIASRHLGRFNSEDWGWGTYFKSTQFSDFDRPLKVEFIRPAELDHNDIAALREGVMTEALTIAADLSLDTADGFKEPMSQYLADLEAKQVSDYVNHLTSMLTSTIPVDRMSYGIIGSYRT